MGIKAITRRNLITKYGVKMVLYMIVYKNWHKEYRLAKNSKDAKCIGKAIYTDSDVWYTREM